MVLLLETQEEIGGLGEDGSWWGSLTGPRLELVSNSPDDSANVAENPSFIPEQKAFSSLRVGVKHWRGNKLLTEL